MYNFVSLFGKDLMKKIFLSLIGAILLLTPAAAQVAGSVPVEVDYNSPKTYVVGGVRVSGTKYLGESQLLSVLGIRPEHISLCDGGIPAAVDFLERCRKEQLTPGTYEIDGRNLYDLVLVYSAYCLSNDLDLDSDF